MALVNSRANCHASISSKRLIILKLDSFRGCPLKPETMKPETMKPETLKPETLKPETLKP
jgi:hypothetical protein